MRLKEIRENKRMTQKQMADYLGLSQPVYSHYENETRQPSIEVLKRMSKSLCVSVDFIIGNEDFCFDGLSNYETRLVAASRMADERAKTDALQTLLSHQVQKRENVG